MSVIAGLDPAIHHLRETLPNKIISEERWMPGSSPGMTIEKTALRRVHQHQFGIFQRGDLQPCLVADRDAVAGVDAHAVDLNRTRGRHQIEVARLAGRILRAVAGLQRGGEYPCVGADRQRVLIVSESAGDGDEVAGAIRLRERLCTPGWLAAVRGRLATELGSFL